MTPKIHKKTIHIFRRDYRLHDNTTLLEACQNSETIIPLFIFTHKQIANNSLRNNNCIQFMCESLIDLNTQLGLHNSKLLILFGDEFEIIEKLLKKDPEITAISFNIDYTLYAIKRDSQITNLFKKMRSNSSNSTVIAREDIMLNPLNSILTTTGKMYSKFTPYYNAASSRDIHKPTKNTHKNYMSTRSLDNLLDNLGSGFKTITLNDLPQFYDNKYNDKLPNRGGRTNALKILSQIGVSKKWTDYNENRDMLTYETTHLSAYNKFGCVSCREVYHVMVDKLGKNNQLITQLFWRDFFYNLSYNNPVIYEHALNPKFANIKWPGNMRRFEAWKNARTGYPIVDACMREIAQTGFMHNRGRLIVSNFLIRILQVDWRHGEHYFARMLYDYDPAQNNFGWQIGATVSGTESRPLSQTILNPWLQSAKFDPDAIYIKRWIPELANIPAGKIHKWYIYGPEIIKNQKIKYPLPIADYETEKEYNLRLYRKYL